MRRTRGPAVALAVCGVLIGAVSGGAQAALPFPSPLAGPGAPATERREQKRLESAWQALASGRPDRASKRARRLGEGATSRLLRLQLELLEERGDQLPAVTELADRHPDWAAAWATLSVAAENAGDEAAALSAARRVDELWPESAWAARAADLARRWIGGRVSSAGRALEDGDGAQAIELADRALALEPDNRDGLMVKARALLMLEEIDDAERVLALLPADPEALLLAGGIAEQRGDWLGAMERYESLPPDAAGREDALRRAKIRWRLSVLPDHIQRALVADPLTRADLAVLLVALVPELEAVGGGRVQVLSDIVDLESQREIVNVVRLELMRTDPLEHRFLPGQPASADEVREAVDRLGRLLGLQTPVWCDDTVVVSSPCADLTEPIRGEAVAELILGTVYGEGP